MSEELSAYDAGRVAAEWHADIGVQHVAAVYAEAILDAAEKAGQTAALLAEFDSLVADVLDRFPALEQVLGSRLVSPEEKVGVIDRAFGGSGSPLLVNSLKVVARHERLDCLRAIHARLHERFDQVRGRVRVVLSTASPVDDAQAARIADSLRQMLGGEPVLERITDPSLIGGAVLRVGDTVYDGSIAMQLEQVRKHMIDRSVHEIQSRRDRFRYPAGD
jgi:F-type H+-transporting ATPase subunit delta